MLAVNMSAYSHGCTCSPNAPGSFQLENIPTMPRGVPRLELVFEADANGILKVSAATASESATTGGARTRTGIGSGAIGGIRQRLSIRAAGSGIVVVLLCSSTWVV